MKKLAIQVLTTDGWVPATAQLWGPSAQGSIGFMIEVPSLDGKGIGVELPREAALLLGSAVAAAYLPELEAAKKPDA